MEANWYVVAACGGGAVRGLPAAGMGVAWCDGTGGALLCAIEVTAANQIPVLVGHQGNCSLTMMARQAPRSSSLLPRWSSWCGRLDVAPCTTSAVRIEGAEFGGELESRLSSGGWGHGGVAGGGRGHQRPKP
uniref:Uncharacterized protein n=1 Tax=Arundo donax TaxID=35708 RepID=A0A0A8YMP9_ARUDO